MEQMKKNRKTARTMFTKNAEELRQLFADNAAVNRIKVSWELLVAKDSKLKSLDEDIYNMLLNDEEVSEEDLLAEMEYCETYRKKFIELSIMYEDIFRETKVAVSRDPSEISTGNNLSADGRNKRKFKLPTIEFKTFNGNIKDWLGFWSQFSKIHEDPDIDLNDKVEYLIKATVPGSRARQVVESFPAVGKNYQAMIDCLKSRFGREDLQIEVSVRELLKIIIGNAVPKGKVDLCSLYDGIETQLRVLETMGIKSKECSAMLFPLIESCIPDELLRVWQRSPLAMSVDNATESDPDSEESPLMSKLKNILKFLRSEVENEQRISLASEGFGLRTPNNLPINKHRGQVVGGTKRTGITFSEESMPTAAGLVTFEKKFDPAKCIFCEGNHDSPSCFKAQHFTLEKRKEIASSTAYAAVIFLRCVDEEKVSLHLLAAKSRVAPLKQLTIPRLELLAALIGVRLAASIKAGLQVDFDCHFWTDSSTVLSWIGRNEEWGTFVYNRIAEIRLTTSVEMWHHVPGTMNPADLPSRGCSAKQLKESRWWEGPKWLYGDPDTWPSGNFTCNEEEISQERKKQLVTTLVNLPDKRMTLEDWHLNHFSKHLKTVRMMAWIRRYVQNLRCPGGYRGELTTAEIDVAEMFIFQLIQSESFKGLKDNRLSTLNPFEDENGVIRLKTRVSARKDTEQFRYPVVLPPNHPMVVKIIFDAHVKSCHVGTQGLMSILREKYWILGGRRVIRSTISKCVVCKRYNSKPFGADVPPLPLDRVRDAAAFEVTGVDFAGPLFLKNELKVWICLFTCAVYRAVHLELCTSLSTINFLQAFRRFVSRRGRPRIIYSDNGTNFVGSDNAFKNLNWNKIAEISSTERIIWRFNPPSAPWWGGFWERLVGVLKRLLRKTLGRASLNYEELLTVLCDCESIINSRPLTYMSSEPGDLQPLTPEMFLREQQGSGLPDCDAIDRKSLCKRVQYLRKIRDDLRCRFRSEYLGQLKFFRKNAPHRTVKIGEIVLIGNDQEKRLDWPLGMVSELVPGRDGQIRLVKLTTARGQLMRPIQRLFPLECLKEEDSADSAGVTKRKASEPSGVTEPGSARMSESKVSAPKPESVVTRQGRVTKTPKRFLE